MSSVTYDKAMIDFKLNEIIQRSQVNDWLIACDSNWRVVPYRPELSNVILRTCQNEADRINWTASDTTNKWLIGLRDKNTGNIHSYISFILFYSEVDDIRDNMCYILKTCTDNQYGGRGISKLLHWVLIQISLTLEMDYISAYVTSNIEEIILKSMGGFPLSSSEESDTKAIIDEIMSTHGVLANYVLVLESENEQYWEMVKQEIIKCSRPR